MKINKSMHLSFGICLHFVAVCCMTASAIAGNYANEVKTDNPTAYFRLEESAGSATVDDAMGTFIGNWVYDTDPSGNQVYPKLEQPGLDVNSAGFHPYTDSEGMLHKSYGEIPYDEALNPATNFSVEFWARPTSIPASGANRVPVNNFGGWSGTYPGWIVYQSGGPDSRWIWIMKGGGVWMDGGSVAALQWYHLVATYDGSTVHFYVNGELKSSSAVAGYEPNIVNSLYIGLWDASDTEKNWDGNVDEIALYNHILPLDRIQSHYQVGTNSIRVAATAPSLIQAPVSVTNFVGHVVRFDVTADGTGPLSYQWYKGQKAIPGETNAALSFTCALADNGTLYKVVVANKIGSTESALATLTVDTGLAVSANPTSISRYTGSTAAFRVLADGAIPLNYQWYKGTTLIPGATDATLWLTNIQLSDDSSTYYARVSNAFSATNTETATLTVTERPVIVPLDGYAKIVKADGPVGYWRLNEAAGSEKIVDAAGSFDGTFDDGAGEGVIAYQVPTGIPNATDTAMSFSKKARAVIPYALELNPLGNFSVEAWLKPASLGADDADYRTAFSSQGEGLGGPTGWLVYQQPNNTWAWIIWGDYWINSFLVVPDVPVVANTWYHMVLIYDGQFKIYINGELKLTESVDAFVQNQKGSINLGWRNDNDWKPWDGTLDEVAFYNKVLTSEQIQSHYLNSTNVAKVTLSIERSGGNVVLSWPSGTLQQSDTSIGNYTELADATSPYTIKPSAVAKFYRVKVR